MSSVLTLSPCVLQLYGAATMNNTLGLAVFAALIYFRDLDWQFSAGEALMFLLNICVYLIFMVQR